MRYIKENIRYLLLPLGQILWVLFAGGKFSQHVAAGVATAAIVAVAYHLRGYAEDRAPIREQHPDQARANVFATLGMAFFAICGMLVAGFIAWGTGKIFSYGNNMFPSGAISSLLFLAYVMYRNSRYI